MNRQEFAQALRERFATVRRDFPELVELVREASDQRVLEAHARCGACRDFHIPLDECVAIAAECATLEDFLPRHQALCLERFPAWCLSYLDQYEETVVNPSKPS